MGGLLPQSSAELQAGTGPAGPLLSQGPPSSWHINPCKALFANVVHRDELAKTGPKLVEKTGGVTSALQQSQGGSREKVVVQGSHLLPCLFCRQGDEIDIGGN